MGGKRIRAKDVPARDGVACSGSSGVFGLDVSDPNVAGSSWSCMHEQGNYSFAVVECWRGGYQLSPCASNIASAWNEGFRNVDAYSFMCPNCNNGPQSVQSLVNYLQSNSVRYGMIWVDVEECNGCWYDNNLAANCAWVKNLASTYQSLGVRVGVYTSAYEWSATVGPGCDMSQFPLWYADYDKNPSFSGFRPFAGWSAPSIKQFSDSADNSCGVSIDRDWYP